MSAAWKCTTLSQLSFLDMATKRKQGWFTGKVSTSVNLIKTTFKKNCFDDFISLEMHEVSSFLYWAYNLYSNRRSMNYTREKSYFKFIKSKKVKRKKLYHLPFLAKYHMYCSVLSYLR